MWGKEVMEIIDIQGSRITPTCVGKRLTGFLFSHILGDHPHVCGEKLQNLVFGDLKTGSPPRVWGKVVDDKITGTTRRITPTCVGKRWCYYLLYWKGWGSPPRVWGKD